MFRFAACVGSFATLPVLIPISWWLSFLIALSLYAVSGGWKNIQILAHCIPRDIKFFFIAFKMSRFLKKSLKSKFMIYDYLLINAEKHPNKTAYISVETGEKMTSKEAYELANRIANYFYGKGYRQGDTVSLMMENRNEYIPIWLGLSKLGVVTALINTNLKEESLQHCIDIVKTKGFIYTSQMVDSVKTINVKSIETYYWDSDNDKSLSQDLKVVSTSEPKVLFREDKEILYIYTSGTTGLPKAVLMKALKCVRTGFGLATLANVMENDICYNVLPFYHGNAGLMVAALTLTLGNTLVLRKKFSASNFFKDCCKYDCTYFNYIGEICRYLLAQPPREFDCKHKIRFATGNGLKGSIWKEFQERFDIPDIKEFFGASEGNFFFMNTTNKVGSVGFYPLIMNLLKMMRLVKVDESTGKILRGPNGLGIPVKCGEPGMLVSKIDEERLAGFDGYTSKEATQKKIEYNVISKGDGVFVFGDMLYADEYGYYYFSDRLGDTFRWKGENVSTNEVEGVISKILQLNDVCVYAVEIKGIEGKTGMACIVDPERKVDVNKLSEDMNHALPSYARPMFLRLTDSVVVTGTFKFQKVDLRKAGFNPANCGDDHLYYFDLKTKSYLPLNNDNYSEILAGKVRF